MNIHRWIHEEGDPGALILMRRYFGALIVWQMAWLAPQYSRWFMAGGWIYSDCTPMSWNFAAGGWGCAAIILVTALAGAAMVANRHARMANIAAWLGLAILDFHFEPASGGGDLITVYAAFILMFARTGEVKVPLWPQKLLLLSVATFYTSAVLHKLGDPCWRDGSATYYALQYQVFSFWPVPELLKLPQVSPYLTYGALLIEAALGLLPFMLRWKVPLAVSGIFLHAGIGWALFIPQFGPAMVGLYLSAFRGEELRAK